ncbi:MULTISPECIES: toxin YdaT family protein [unclassified Serratia (in: enterobacteria)]|uniref:toxin YdaT family protein n=1 Tax=unclassified Serratia (in: enterobacteria) TaxID=2647522 RepID=UPI00307614F1
MRNMKKLKKERLELEKLKNEVINWAAMKGQEHVTIEITRMWLKLCPGPQRVKLYQIENEQGEADAQAINTNRQAIFRWLRGESKASRAKLRELANAIAAALPAERRAHLEGNTVNLLISVLLRDVSNVVTAVLLDDRDAVRHIRTAHNSLNAILHHVTEN